jgi:hypothetical protein|nr:MAG TPA: Lower collar protein [Caudoviricetes sp.]
MAKYTIEVNSLLLDSQFNLFSFDYDFYTNNEEIKKNFEKKFTDTYRFNEIGFETVARFKHFLKTKLNNIMPYYSKLYETELKAQDINFLLNKDLTETFEKDIVSTGLSSSNQNINDVVTQNTKESNIENGNASLNLENGSLTNVSQVTNDNQNNINSINEVNNNQKEQTVFKSQGNIGITSSAELLAKWRDVIINIDKQIIDECADLFMMIF